MPGGSAHPVIASGIDSITGRQGRDQARWAALPSPRRINTACRNGNWNSLVGEPRWQALRAPIHPSHNHLVRTRQPSPRAMASHPNAVDPLRPMRPIASAAERTAGYSYRSGRRSFCPSTRPRSRRRKSLVAWRAESLLTRSVSRSFSTGSSLTLFCLLSATRLIHASTTHCGAPPGCTSMAYVGRCLR